MRLDTDLVDIKTAAHILGVSTKTLKRWEAQGKGQVPLADLTAITPGAIEAKFWSNYEDECEDF